MAKKPRKWNYLVSKHCLQLFLLVNLIKWGKMAFLAFFGRFWGFLVYCLPEPKKGVEDIQIQNFMANSGRLGPKLYFRVRKSSSER